MHMMMLLMIATFHFGYRDTNRLTLRLLVSVVMMMLVMLVKTCCCVHCHLVVVVDHGVTADAADADQSTVAYWSFV